MVFDNDFRVLVLDHLRQFAEECRLTDTCHILETDFLSAGLYLLVGELAIVFEGVYGRSGYAQRSLRGHAGFLCPLDRRRDVADVVQTVEDTRDVDTLSVLHLIHHPAHIVGHGVHAQSVQSTVEHVGFDAGFVERLAERTDGLVRILTCKQLNLLESTAVGLYAREASHLDDYRSYTLQLVLAWLELSGALPHVTINETELNFLSH